MKKIICIIWCYTYLQNPPQSIGREGIREQSVELEVTANNFNASDFICKNVHPNPTLINENIFLSAPKVCNGEGKGAGL